MNAVVGWVLDVSLSEQQMCAMLIMFRDAAGRWVLDVSLSGQESCAKLSYFLPRDWWLLHLFSNLPMKFESVKVEDAADIVGPNVTLSEQ
jgi:hypothetical protein